MQDNRPDSSSHGSRCPRRHSLCCGETDFSGFFSPDIPLILLGFMVLVQTALVCVLACNALDKEGDVPPVAGLAKHEEARDRKPGIARASLTGMPAHAGGAAVVTGQVQGTRPLPSPSGCPATPVTDVAGQPDASSAPHVTDTVTRDVADLLDRLGQEPISIGYGDAARPDLERILAELLARYPMAREQDKASLTLAARASFDGTRYPALSITLAQDNSKSVPMSLPDLAPKDMEAVVRRLSSAPELPLALVDELLERVPGLALASSQAQPEQKPNRALLVFTQPDCRHCKRAQALLQELSDRLDYPVLLMPVGKTPSSLALYTAKGKKPSADELALANGWLLRAEEWLLQNCGAGMAFVPTFVWVKGDRAHISTLTLRELVVLLAVLNVEDAGTGDQGIPTSPMRAHSVNPDSGPDNGPDSGPDNTNNNPNNKPHIHTNQGV